MHDRLFANQKELEPWKPHAEAVGLDVPRFEACMSTGKYSEDVRREISDAAKAGVNSTPIFFLAYTQPGSTKVKTVVRLTGAQPYAAFKAQIDKLLAEALQPEPPKAEPKPN